MKILNDRNQDCTLEIMDVRSGSRQKLKSFDRVIEAPNWTGDGKSLVYNSGGRIFGRKMPKMELPD